VFDFDSSIERKNPLATVLAFQDAFRAGEKVELIVKTSNVNPQHWSNASRHWENLIASALGDRRIRIVTQRYSNDEMTALVRDADCVVSLHRSEGFGYLAADAMAFGTPVIATDYSGNTDFCTPDNSYPVPYRLVGVPAGAARWRCDDALWADADIAAAAAQMQAVFENREVVAEKAERARLNIKSKYAIEIFAAALRTRIDAIRAAGNLLGLDRAGVVNMTRTVARATNFRD
jgi:glycosyltransferase involved in cell wall biosynthesis